MSRMRNETADRQTNVKTDQSRYNVNLQKEKYKYGRPTLLYHKMYIESYKDTHHMVVLFASVDTL